MTLLQVCPPFHFYRKKDQPGFNREFMPKGQMTTREEMAPTSVTEGAILPGNRVG